MSGNVWGKKKIWKHVGHSRGGGEIVHTSPMASLSNTKPSDRENYEYDHNEEKWACLMHTQSILP